MQPALAPANMVQKNPHFPLYAPAVPAHLEFSIKPSKVRKFIKHFLKASNSKSGLLSEKYKSATFPAEIRTPGASAAVNAKFRLTGDYTDHIESYLPSLSINLKDGNIGNITRFRLLIPETKSGDDEIILSLIFEALGFPTLFTRNVLVTTERSSQSMIFQEKVAKEFLERWRFREGPVIETDERNIWIRRKIHTENPVGRRNLPGPYSLTIDNDEFLKNSVAKGISIDALTLGNIASFNRFKIKRIQRRQLFDDLHHVFSAEHGLVAHNRKFIFDPMYRELVPIYYDGNPKLSDTLDLKKIHGTTKSALLTIDIEDLYLEYQERGGTRKFRYLERLFEHISGLEEIPCCKNLKDPDLLYSFSGTKKYNYFPDAVLHMKDQAFLCNSMLPLTLQLMAEQCSTLDGESELRILKRKKLKSRRFQNLYQPMTFGSVMPKGNHLIFDFSEPDDGFTDFPCSDGQGESKISIGTTQVIRANLSAFRGCNHFSPVRITIHHDESSIGRIIFSGQAPQGLKLEIRFQGLRAPDNLVRYERNLLTGCVTFLDAHLRQIELDINGAPCEDGINFVRSSGTVRDIIAKNSSYDSVDADFSDLLIEKAQVSDAGNDCIDFSAGTYEILNGDLRRCKDKAISVGEKATVTTNFLSIEDSLYGVVSKDGSIAKVKHLKAADVDVCLAAYRKKIEFNGSKIVAGTLIGCAENSEIDELSKVVYEAG